MTVAELFEKLKDVDPEYQVCLEDGRPEIYPLSFMETDDKGKRVILD